jgi:predicted ester cyclase
MKTQTFSHLTLDNDLTKTQESMDVISKMGEALENNDHNMAKYFHESFQWKGNYGCGEKQNLAHFRTGWQLPLRKAFSDRKYITEAQFAQGEWVAAFGYIDALHSGEFMGIKPTLKRVVIKFMDVWNVKDKRVANNWVNVDFPHLLAQLGVDVFDGKGWEHIHSPETHNPE